MNENTTEPKTTNPVSLGTAEVSKSNTGGTEQNNIQPPVKEESGNINTQPNEQSLPSDPDEEKEIKEVKTSYKLTPKLQRWIELVLDPKNEDTFGNATQSAIQAYNLDPEKQYHVASQIGYVNMRKVENMASMYAAKKGFGIGKLMDIAMNKAITTDNPGWWDRVAEMIRVRDRKEEGSGNTINNIQINQFQLNSMEVDSLNKEFITFLDGKYRKTT